jgi:hypothetical protein
MPLFSFEHLRIANQTYVAHMLDAWTFGFQAFIASLAFFVHGIYPDAFPHTGGNFIKELNHDIQSKYAAMNSDTISHRVVFNE